jgi:hypothetical protein
MTKEKSIIMGVSNPRTDCTAATRELSSGTIPFNPKALLNIVLKGISALTMTPEPALRIKKPRMVFRVPATTVDGLFRISKSPAKATRPITILGVLKNWTKKFTIINASSKL